jgi:hypothetical protein
MVNIATTPRKERWTYNSDNVSPSKGSHRSSYVSLTRDNQATHQEGKYRSVGKYTRLERQIGKGIILAHPADAETNVDKTLGHVDEQITDRNSTISMLVK